MNTTLTKRCALAVFVATAMGAASGEAHAVEEAAFLEAFTNATLAGATQGDTGSFGTLSILLAMPEPWRDTILATVERGDLIASLESLRSTRRGAERRKIDTLSQRVAALQGQASRAGALDISLGAVSVELRLASPQWVSLTGLPVETGELQVSTLSCTPDIVAFPGSASLPATPIAGQVRLSAQLTSIPIEAPVALRIMPGDCEDDEISLQLSRTPSRVAFTRGSEEGEGTEGVSRFPALEIDRITVAGLVGRPAETFSVRTEPGFVYEVYAAPLAANLDPMIVRGDSSSPGELMGASDDDGWELGARLSSIVGTGRLEKFAVIRNPSGSQGDVALLVRREAIPTLDPSSRTSALVSESQPTWRRMRLPAGTWSIRTGDMSRSLDPMLTVYDGESGRELDSNDDASKDDPAARVTVQLDEPREVVLRLDSIDGAGECTLEAAPIAKPAATRGTDAREARPTVST